MGKPYFSVVIDNYNYGRYLGQCVESVLSQDFPAAEVETIVVDDGSTDDSREVAGLYKDGVHLIAQVNRGQAGAFAAGFAVARGEVVCPLDSDDYWEPGKLTAVAEALEDPSVGIVQHYQRDVDAGGRPLNNPLPAWPARYALADFLDGRFINAATSSLAVRRDVLDKVLPVPKDIFYLYDDYLLDFGLLHADIANVPRILGYHRIHGANNWARNFLDPGKLEASLREIDAFRAYLEPRLSERGLAFSPRYDALREIELLKREVLIHMYRGERGKAAGVWARMLRCGWSPFGFFRAATCALALVSPALYLRAYALYSDRHWLSAARRRALPEPRP